MEVLTTDSSGKLPREEQFHEVTVRRFRSWAPGNAYDSSEELRKYLTRFSSEYDLVHAHDYHSLPALYAAKAKRDTKLVFTPHYHGSGHSFFRSLLHVAYKYVAKEIFEKADRVVCVSNTEKTRVTRRFKVSEQKVAVIPNGINSKEFEGLGQNSDKNSKVILYVGRLEKYKGIDYLVKALPKLDERVRLEIVGKGPHKKALLRLIRESGLVDRVAFFQDLPREQLLHMYAGASVFALLSAHEAYGITVAEALAAGTPCIVPVTSSLGEWVDGRNCFGINYPIKTDDLAKAIDEVIDKRLRVESCRLLDWNDVTMRVINLYEGISRTKEISFER